MKTTLEQAERWELIAIEKRECLLAERERHLANAAAYRQEAEGKKRAARWLEREETPRHLRDPALARDLWKDYRDLHRLVDWSEKRAEELRREAGDQREYAEKYRAIAVTLRTEGGES